VNNLPPPVSALYRRFDCIGTMAGGKFRFAIDRGGTFTDVYSECPNGEVRVMKLLSVDPAYPDAPKEGIRRILQEVIYSSRPRTKTLGLTGALSIGRSYSPGNGLRDQPRASLLQFWSKCSFLI